MMFRALRVGMTHQTHKEIQKNILHQILHIYLLIKNPKIHFNNIYNSVCKSDVFLLNFLFLSEFAEYIIIISLLIFAKQEHLDPKSTPGFQQLKGNCVLKASRLHQDDCLICKFSEKPDVVQLNWSMRDLKPFAETPTVAVRRHKGSVKLLW